VRHYNTCRNWIFAAFALAAAGATNLASGQEIEFDPSYARNPPAVSRADFELLAKRVSAGNAILRLQFADQRRGTLIAIQGGPGPTYLRDDGKYPDAKTEDGVYAAIVNLNTEAYLREQQRRVELAKRYKTLPRFNMRELIDYEPFRPSPVPQLKSGARFNLDRFRGVPFGINAWKELLITSVSVVEDPGRTFDRCTGAGTPMGAWTFGKLMTEMANQPATGIRPGDFVEQWLQQWNEDLTINTFTVWKRDRVQLIIDDWPRLPDGQLDLAQAPFRLLAIVNRQDLRGNTLYGSGDAGEARFVFGLLDCNHVLSPAGDEEEFLVIMEYGIRKNTCMDVKAWAQEWRALGGLIVGSAAYNAQLQAITDQFTLANANPFQLPNRSAINQVRMNEFALVGSDAFWQLRESTLNSCGLFCWLPSAGRLTHKTTAQTPDGWFMGSVAGRLALRDFINTNQASILVGTHAVSLTLPGGQHFRGGAIDPGAGFAWNPAGVVNLDARHEFSKATCNGCHTSETGTDFVHISTRAPGTVSQLSDFLTGLNMPKSDPVSTVDRTFHELLDRQQKLDATANMSCLKATDFAVEEVLHEFMPPVFAH